MSENSVAIRSSASTGIAPRHTSTTSCVAFAGAARQAAAGGYGLAAPSAASEGTASAASSDACGPLQEESADPCTCRRRCDSRREGAETNSKQVRWSFLRLLHKSEDRGGHCLQQRRVGQ